MVNLLGISGLGMGTDTTWLGCVATRDSVAASNSPKQIHMSAISGILLFYILLVNS